VDWKFCGTPTRIDPGESMVFAMAAIDVNSPAAIIPNVFIFPPIDLMLPAALVELPDRLPSQLMNIK
jgi:hypothetical protein